jgi:hypothetical protein
MTGTTLTTDTLTEPTQRFQLPCGCAITEAPEGTTIAWCPHHEMLHGVIPMRPHDKERVVAGTSELQRNRS